METYLPNRPVRKVFAISFFWFLVLSVSSINCLAASVNNVVEIGVIYSNDCEFQSNQVSKYATVWERKSDGILMERSYDFLTDSIQYYAVSEPIIKKSQMVMRRIFDNAMEVYEVGDGYFRLIEYVDGSGKSQVLNGVQQWDSLPTKKEYKCRNNSGMVTALKKFTLRGCSTKTQNEYLCTGFVSKNGEDSRYFGNLHGGKENGWGVDIKSNDEIYVGEFYSGKRHGQGFFYKNRILMAHGEWVNGIFKHIKPYSEEDVPIELRFDFTLPRCKDVILEGELKTSTREACLVVVDTVDGYVLGEIDAKSTSPNALFVPKNDGNVVSMMGQYVRDNSFSGESIIDENVRLGRMRYSVNSVAVGLFNKNILTMGCIYGGDWGEEDVGNGQKSGKCY